jgi:carbamoyltransferase
MILTFNSRNTDQIRAGSHPEDGTVRPQIVECSWNPEYHRTIELFRAKTGRGAVLNTSFNIHGEPIASTPAQAVDVLQRSGLRHLCLGNYLISKRD